MPLETRAVRSKSGCLTCRRRHLKCNEQRPRCRRCTSSKLPCEYPPETDSSNLDHDPFVFPHAQPWLPTPTNLTFVSEVSIPARPRPDEEVERRVLQRRRSRRKSSVQFSALDSMHVPGSLPSPTSTSSDRDEGDMATPASTKSPSPGQVCESNSPHEKAPIRSVYAPGPYKPIEDPQVSHLLQYYMHHIAPWLDLTDPLCHFARRVPHMAIRCPMLRYAILALASSRILRVEEPSEFVSDQLMPSRYYGACMSYLIPALEVPDIAADVAIPVTTVILHTYEIFEGHHDSQNHLSGTMSVFAHQRHRLRRPGIRRTTFWTYIRQEIIVALQTRRPTNIELPSWQGDMYWGEDSDDAWANRMSWLLVKVINLYFDTEHDGQRATDESATFLQEEISNWRGQAPLTLGPLCTLATGVCDEEPFPIISYTCLWHFIGMQFYHLACILLTLKSPQSSSGPHDMLSHAHQIVGAAITLGRRSHGAMINSIGPLIICGQVITRPSERMRLLSLLTEIGAVTGWPVNDETAKILHGWSVT